MKRQYLAHCSMSIILCETESYGPEPSGNSTKEGKIKNANGYQTIEGNQGVSPQNEGKLNNSLFADIENNDSQYCLLVRWFMHAFTFGGNVALRAAFVHSVADVLTSLSVLLAALIIFFQVFVGY